MENFPKMILIFNDLDLRIDRAAQFHFQLARFPPKFRSRPVPAPQISELQTASPNLTRAGRTLPSLLWCIRVPCVETDHTPGCNLWKFPAFSPDRSVFNGGN